MIIGYENYSLTSTIHQIKLNNLNSINPSKDSANMYPFSNQTYLYQVIIHYTKAQVDPSQSAMMSRCSSDSSLEVRIKVAHWDALML